MLKEWGIFLILMIGIIYLFAPRSWFQFGVKPFAQRVSSSEVRLNGYKGEGAFSLADAKGKVLLINYWATWCGPCRFETPGLVNINNEFKNENFALIGVTVDDDLTAVPSFIGEYGINYRIMLPGFDSNVNTGNMKLPTSFLYDKNGNLAKKYDGIVLESTLRSDIKSLLAE